jgi:tRNA 2-thiouridine synthesizing protein A|tara:strand:+ start:623 stop:853 length:231 start_codon:yes stop_codon:yes gene_type:complete
MINKVDLLDLKGLKCPIPVLRIAKKVKSLKKGQIFLVCADDINIENDIEELTKNIKIEIIEKNKKQNLFTFKILKK